MSDNPDAPVRKTVSVSASMWQRVEDFQLDHRIKRNAEAIRCLIELGLEAAKAKPTATTGPPSFADTIAHALDTMPAKEAEASAPDALDRAATADE